MALQDYVRSIAATATVSKQQVFRLSWKNCIYPRHCVARL
jgi:hypothetical protein